jgi:carbonic anhydrase
LTINYGSDNGKIFYNNETCQVAINSQKMYISGGPLGEERYYLTQFHTHEVSEHHIDGMAYPLELHLVHTSLTGKIAVLALFFRVGPQNNSFVESFVTHCHLRKPLGANLNLTSLLDQYLLKYYTYTGSLTTPPCTEGVRWILLKKEYFITRKQLSMFLQVLPHHGANNRPIQRAYGRAVFSN